MSSHLTDAQAREIYLYVLFDEADTSVLCRAYGVTARVVSDIVGRRTHRPATKGLPSAKRPKPCYKCGTRPTKALGLPCRFGLWAGTWDDPKLPTGWVSDERGDLCPDCC